MYYNHRDCILRGNIIRGESMRLQNAIDASLALVQLYPSSHQRSRPPPKNLKKPAVRASCKAIKYSADVLVPALLNRNEQLSADVLEIKCLILQVDQRDASQMVWHFDAYSIMSDDRVVDGSPTFL